MAKVNLNLRKLFPVLAIFIIGAGVGFLFFKFFYAPKKEVFVKAEKFIRADEGGEIVLENLETEKVILQIPKESLTEDTNISVTSVSDETVSGAIFEKSSQTVRLEPDNLVLQKPATLKFEITESPIKDQTKIYYWKKIHDKFSAWVPIESFSVDESQKAVTGLLSHFSEYTVISGINNISSKTSSNDLKEIKKTPKDSKSLTYDWKNDKNTEAKTYKTDICESRSGFPDPVTPENYTLVGMSESIDGVFNEKTSWGVQLDQMNENHLMIVQYFSFSCSKRVGDKETNYFYDHIRIFIYSKKGETATSTTEDTEKEDSDKRGDDQAQSTASSKINLSVKIKKVEGFDSIYCAAMGDPWINLNLTIGNQTGTPILLSSPSQAIDREQRFSLDQIESLSFSLQFNCLAGSNDRIDEFSRTFTKATNFGEGIYNETTTNGLFKIEYEINKL